MTAPPNRAAVTTVVPTHNRRAVLPITLRSVLAQQEVDLEVVVVDDGSSDGTGPWLEEHHDPRLRVVRQDEPRGVAAARAAGVEATTTPYVAFCDDDDVWAPDKLARQFDALEHDPAARWSCTSSMSFVVAGPGDVELVHYQETPSAEEALPRLLGYNAVPGGGSSVLADTALVRDAGGFRTGMAEDWDMWVRLALAAPVAPVPRPLCGYRVWRTANSSRSYDLQAMQAGIDAVRDRYADERATWASISGPCSKTPTSRRSRCGVGSVAVLRALREPRPSRPEEAGVGVRRARVTGRGGPGDGSPSRSLGAGGAA